MKVELTLTELFAILGGEKREKVFACDGCKHYDPCSALEEPCKSCARNHGDYYERCDE